MKDPKGSITVMLILVLCSVLMVTTLLVEVARVRIAEGQVKRAVDTAIFSALADYDQDIKDSYGLFYRYGAEGIEEEIQLTIEKNLLISDGSSAWQPYEYKVESVNVRVLFPMSDQESIRHQIVEYMKYRAPKTLLGDAAEKLSLFFSMQATASVMKADLSVDRKIKRMAEAIQELKEAITAVSGYSDVELSNFNDRSTEVLEKAEDIKSLQIKINRLRERGADIGAEDRRTLSSLEEQMGFARGEMLEAGEKMVKEIRKVVESNRQALEICRKLRRLGPETEQAIKESENVMEKEKNSVTRIRTDLDKKYADYRQYCDIKKLSSVESALEGNIRLLEPKIELLQKVMSGKVHNGPPAVFKTRGYQAVSFIHDSFADSPEQPQGQPVNLTPEALRKLATVVQRYRDDIRRTITTKDKGPIHNCPGNRFEDLAGDAAVQGDDPYEQGAGFLDLNYELVGGDVDGDSFIEAVGNGTLQVSRDIYESLLVNEYIIETFNNRESGGKDKRVLEETEVEYILIGSNVPGINAVASQMEIVAWRTVFNAVSFGYYCPEISRAIDGAAVSLNALSGVPYPVWKGVLTGMLSLIESLTDTKRMLCSDAVPLFKYRIDDVSIMRELQDLTSELGINTSLSGERGKDLPAKNLEVNYKDHLRSMLMYRSLLGQNDKTLRRIQDIIYTNILSTRGEYDPDKHTNFIEVDARVSMKSFFPNVGAVNTHLGGIPMRHFFNVECGRGY